MFHEIYEIRDALVEGSGWSGSRPITVDAGESVTPSLSPLYLKLALIILTMPQNWTPYFRILGPLIEIIVVLG